MIYVSSQTSAFRLTTGVSGPLEDPDPVRTQSDRVVHNQQLHVKNVAVWSATLVPVTFS